MEYPPHGNVTAHSILGATEHNAILHVITVLQQVHLQKERDITMIK